MPGVIAGIDTFGELVHWHPHLHALVTRGAVNPQTGDSVDQYSPAGTMLACLADTVV